MLERQECSLGISVSGTTANRLNAEMKELSIICPAVLCCAFLIGCKQKALPPKPTYVSCEAWVGYGNVEQYPSEILLLENHNDTYYLWIKGKEYSFQSYPAIGSYTKTDDYLELTFPLGTEKMSFSEGETNLRFYGRSAPMNLLLVNRGTFLIPSEETRFRYPPREIMNLIPSGSP